MNIPNESDLRFAICIRNDDYQASLELRKVYPVLNDADAARHHMLRVIDESGEDYLYPDDFFMLVELPEAVRRAVMRAA
ncbi:MAG: hypothetical protein KKA36_05590 [Gammaproteobacteria bacterium]|nr:hypothetical protein [Gammaproteobacteria bacterium]MBU2478544.1 hypothetical protein [Gammaproteobacteria bacterium]